MDSSLINLIPNLTARRGISSPGSVARSTASESPPSKLSRSLSPADAEFPLRIRLDGSRSSRWPYRRPLPWVSDESIHLTASMIYEVFLEALRQRLGEFLDYTEPWSFEIVADLRGRTKWRFDKQVMIVGAETWEKVMKGIDESLIRGLEVLCWRQEDVTVKEG